MNTPAKIDDVAFSGQARELGRQLEQAGRTLCLAESCTGGWIAKCLTDVAGSSGWFERGWVTYSNAAKSMDLGVPAELIETDGAVSESVVRAMAEGARLRAGTDLALSVSGVAGPGGGTKAKPVGTVCFALADALDGCKVTTRRFDGDRDEVRRASVAFAMQWLIDHVLAAGVGKRRSDT